MKREHISMEVRCFKCSRCPDSSDEKSAFDGIKKKIFFFFFFISLLSLQVNEFMQSEIQKQLSRSVPRTKCSENMQRIYKRTPKPKCDFIKVAK